MHITCKSCFRLFQYRNNLLDTEALAFHRTAPFHRKVRRKLGHMMALFTGGRSPPLLSLLSVDRSANDARPKSDVSLRDALIPSLRRRSEQVRLPYTYTTNRPHDKFMQGIRTFHEFFGGLNLAIDTDQKLAHHSIARKPWSHRALLKADQQATAARFRTIRSITPMTHASWKT